MRLVFRAFLLGVSLLVAVASAADVTGKWAAEVVGGGDQKTRLTFDLKTNGDKITGSVSMVLNGNSGEFPISEGTTKGDEITFKQPMGEMTTLYKGKVSGNEIKFTRERANGQGQRQSFSAKKI